jgi:hypothetical protein
MLDKNATIQELKTQLLQGLEALSMQQAIFPEPESAIDKIVLAF